ncbi:hypothetical protein N7G274_008075 [Stereocaulon virgatum]|uniref:Uncharacterized protein n=1 Tax=Stereocaulon virgatum TaxID=373712 RepID=A0ABR4A166_9LECA
MGGCQSVMREAHEGRIQVNEYDKWLERNRVQADYHWTLEACPRCGFESTRIAGMKDHKYSKLCNRCEKKDEEKARKAGRR